MDAVNELKGDLNNVSNNIVGHKYIYIEKSTADYIVLHCADSGDDEFSLVCSIKSFNNLVRKLSDWQPTLPKAETVEVDGMVYEIGKLYLTGGGTIAKLTGLINGRLRVMTMDGECDVYNENKLYKVYESIGTITPAPTKLIDGDVYHFELNCDLWVGFYRQSRGSFFTQLAGGNKICSSKEASQITPLTASK